MCTLKVGGANNDFKRGDSCFAVDSAMDGRLLSSVPHGLVVCGIWKVPGCRTLGLVVRSCVGPNRMCEEGGDSALGGAPVGAGGTPECCDLVTVGPVSEEAWRPRGGRGRLLLVV